MHAFQPVARLIGHSSRKDYLRSIGRVSVEHGPMEGQVRIEHTVRSGCPRQGTGWRQGGTELYTLLSILGIAHTRPRTKGLQEGGLSLAADAVQTSIRLLHTQHAARRCVGDVDRPRL
jgi:hypothetical protein